MMGVALKHFPSLVIATDVLATAVFLKIFRMVAVGIQEFAHLDMAATEAGVGDIGGVMVGVELAVFDGAGAVALSEIGAEGFAVVGGELFGENDGHNDDQRSQSNR